MSSTGYALGIDLGTTFTAAAVWQDGRAEICSLGNRSASIPSVVVLREDAVIITGESADRRAATAPHRAAREFKRRLGDTTPILLGGVPYSAEALMGRLLRAVVDQVSEREGGPPAAVCVSHPANWGPYKTDLLEQAVRTADLENARFTTEPEAAAVFYAGQQRMADGAVVAVYDLGGGTFDAAVLRKTAEGFEILGRPEGIERLGGLDFDAAVYGHVAEALGPALLELDADDPSAIAAVARLKEECTAAKEALSADTDTTIPVLLPNLTTEVRLTRDELEAMVRPALEDTIGALRRALRSAGVTPEQLDSVLLVGGSSRIPVVAQLVATELGRPVAVDAHPKHAVALGAARLAGGTPGVMPEVPEVMASAGAPTAELAAQPTAELAPVPKAERTPELKPQRTPELKPRPAPEPKPQPTLLAPEPPATPVPHQEAAFVEPESDEGDADQPEIGARPAPPVPRDTPRTPRPRLSRTQAAVAAAVVLIALVGAGFALLNRDQHPSTSAGRNAPAVVADPAAACTGAIKANPFWVCLTGATLADGTLTITYDATFGAAGAGPQNGYHLNIYGGDGSSPPAGVEGLQSFHPGHWLETDQNPAVLKTSSPKYQAAIGGAARVCARVATTEDVLVKDLYGEFGAGNCIPIKHS
jgi:molecular chaperone DnaK